MRLVIALGGNALLPRGATPGARLQRERAARAAAALAPLAARHELVLTHGNGPQIGLLALERDADALCGPYPLDMLDAETEGMLGYLLQQEVGNVLAPGRPCVTVLTQVEVAADDPAFAAPDKPIGAVYVHEEAARLAALHGWRVMADGAGWRRAVASPAPRAVVELAAITALLDLGTVVICAGGGGIPVTRDTDGRLAGVEAVVDKDATSALLARELGADALLLLTDVPAVELDWGTAHPRALRTAGVASLARVPFAAGSMAPKVRAACEFVTATGGMAAIGRLEDAAEILARRAGTRVLAELGGATFW